MRIGILGPLQLDTGMTPVTVNGARARALLIRLAVDVGRPVTMDALVSALWPDGAATQPHNAVQTLVSRLRRRLPVDGVVRSVPGGYVLDLPPEAVDAVRFERLARDGRHALGRGDLATGARRLREALSLWRGDALTDAMGAPYAIAEAARLDELRLAAIEDRVAAELDSGPPGTLVAELQALAKAQPLRERVHGLLMRALHADGRRGEALTVFEQFRRRVADELGTDPGAPLRDIHRAVLRDDPLPGPTASPGNLRAELTSFVGRDEERHRLAEQLTSTRLVTLLGPGGAGKTRLATTVAGQLAPTLPGGAWLVELAPVTGADEVAQAAVDALGLREAGHPAGRFDPATRLVDALAATEALLLLDNCEHLLDAVAQLAGDLLGRCPRLRILATSREPLGVGGEQHFPLSPLPVPAAGSSVTQVLDSPAVRLFVDRAAAVRPGFTVTGSDADAVVDICRRLDGLPLAIELAAARLRSMTVAQVAARLNDRFRLLTGGSRTALPRHQTLRAVVAWSEDLLEEPERHAMRRLAVFPDQFTQDAAAEVAGATDDLLAALVDKSLVQLVDTGVQPRYRMLETIREYGRQVLVAAGELERTRAAHAAYCLDLAERAAPHLRGPDQLSWIARLDADGGSAAFSYAVETGDAALLRRLAAALSYYWTLQGDHARAARRLRTALRATGDEPSHARWTIAAAYLFNLLLAGGDSDDSAALRPDPERSAEAAHPPAGADPPAEAATVRALRALVGHDTGAGLAAITPALSDPDPWTRGMAWLLRSWLHGNEGHMAQVRRDLDAAAEAFRRSGDRWGLAVSLTHRAQAQSILGELDDAAAGLTEALEHLDVLGAGGGAALQRVLLAGVSARQGDRARARRDLEKLVAPHTGTQSVGNLVLARLWLGDLARWDGDQAEAARHYDEAQRELSLVPVTAPLPRAILSGGRAHLAIMEGRLDLAGDHLVEALARAVEAPDMPIAAGVAVAVARLVQHRSNTADAATLLGAAHAVRGAPDTYEPDVAALATILRGQLGERAYRTAYERGRRLDRVDALTLFRSWLPAGAGRATAGSDQARRR